MDMKGKTVFITGSTDGVGRYVAAQLAGQGAKVLIHGRDAARGKSLVEEIKRSGGSEPVFYRADLSSLAEVRKLADAVLADHKRIDAFVSNAGIGSQNEGPQRQVSRDGHELRFAVNYLSGFLLAHLLLAGAEGERAVAHRQCCLARPAPDRFRRRHDHQELQRLTRLCAEQAVADHVHDRSGGAAEGQRHHREFVASGDLYEHDHGACRRHHADVDGGAGRRGDPASRCRRRCRRQERAVLQRHERDEGQPQAYDADARRRLRELSLKLTGLPAA